MKIKSNLILTQENDYSKLDYDVITDELVTKIKGKINQLLKTKDEKNQLKANSVMD